MVGDQGERELQRKGGMVVRQYGWAESWMGKENEKTVEQKEKQSYRKTNPDIMEQLGN